MSPSGGCLWDRYTCRRRCLALDAAMFFLAALTRAAVSARRSDATPLVEAALAGGHHGLVETCIMHLGLTAVQLTAVLGRYHGQQDREKQEQEQQGGTGGKDGGSSETRFEAACRLAATTRHSEDDLLRALKRLPTEQAVVSERARSVASARPRTRQSHT